MQKDDAICAGEEIIMYIQTYPSISLLCYTYLMQKGGGRNKHSNIYKSDGLPTQQKELACNCGFPVKDEQI